MTVEEFVMFVAIMVIYGVAVRLVFLEDGGEQ